MLTLVYALCLSLHALVPAAAILQPAAQPESPARQATTPSRAPAETPDPTHTPARSPDWTATIAGCERLIKEAKLPGGALIVVKGDDVLIERYFGSYSKDTVIPIASSSKWLSAAVIMSLVDDGKLTLDTKASDLIPAFKTDDKAQITLRQLFSHTSGLPGNVREAERPRLTIEAAADAIADADLLSKPGAQMRYGGASMQVAARMAEIAGERGWRDLFKDRIATPLTLTNTQYGRLGIGTNPQVAGGASSSLPEYTRFLRMIAAGGTLNGTKVLSKTAVDAMLADQTNNATVAAASVARLLDYHGYGIGNWIDQKDAAGNALINSSPGAFGFQPWVDRSRGVIGIWMIEDRNRERRRVASGFEVREAVNNALDDAFGVPNPDPKPTTMPDAKPDAKPDESPSAK